MTFFTPGHLYTRDGNAAKLAATYAAAWETVRHLHPDAILNTTTGYNTTTVHDPELTEHLTDLQLAALATGGHIPYGAAVHRHSAGPDSKPTIRVNIHGND